MKSKGNYFILFLILVLTTWVSLHGKGNYESVRITRVIDGDTVVVDNNEKVRIIGMNTPEVGKRTEPYGEEAKEFATHILLGKDVYLEKDVSDRDKYGRLLRHIWLKDPKKGILEEDNYGAIALKEGYAQVYTFPPDVKYEKKYLEISRKAREERKGLWGININGTTRGEVPGGQF
ncbi:MAG: thermonuclease family protein [Tissierellia bacterium]|nr:thermonuclease family protein [Tissierellia bacterium]